MLIMCYILFEQQTFSFVVKIVGYFMHIYVVRWHQTNVICKIIQTASFRNHKLSIMNWKKLKILNIVFYFRIFVFDFNQMML